MASSSMSIDTHIGVRPQRILKASGTRTSTTDDYWIVRRGDIIVNRTARVEGRRWPAAKFDGVTSPAYTF